MTTGFLRGLWLWASLLALTACAAPPSAESAAAAPAQSHPTRPPPRMSDPLPPERMPEAGSVVKLDKSCSTDADCVVKNVGNCCGAMPACVNKDSPADPAAVRAECARSGRMSVCGFREISACQCHDGRCEEAGGSGQAVPGPALPARPPG
jgi:hypothetical protein